MAAGNNTFNFEYIENGNIHNLSLVVDEAIYLTRQDFIDELNEQLTNEGLDSLGISFVMDGNYLKLQGQNSGSMYKFQNPGGSFYKEFFQRRDFTYTSYWSNGHTTTQEEAYILGRQSLDISIEIFPEINDTLTFDFYKDNTKYTFDIKVPANTYSREAFIQAFNNSLQEALKNSGLSEDMIVAQIGIEPDVPPATYDKSDKFILRMPAQTDGRNDSGSYRIEGVRGTAAYTYFYNAH